MIPLFPQFKKLELNDKKEIENFTKKFPPYSDYNFTSMWCYNTEDKMRVSWLNGNLVVRFQDYITRELFYSFLGRNKTIETIATLIDYNGKKKLKPVLRLIPEIVVKTNKKIVKFFSTKEDRNNFDYIYSLRDICFLSGARFNKQRYWVNKLMKSFPHVTHQYTNIVNQKLKKELFEIFFTWEKLKNRSRTETIHELKAMRRLLNRSRSFTLTITTIHVNHQIVAFSITEILSKGVTISHFMKIDPSYKGSLALLLKSTAKELLKQKSVYLNREQDLGLETLRRAKEQWNPISFLKKYTITSYK